MGGSSCRFKGSLSLPCSLRPVGTGDGVREGAVQPQQGERGAGGGLYLRQLTHAASPAPSWGCSPSAHPS